MNADPAQLHLRVASTIIQRMGLTLGLLSFFLLPLSSPSLSLSSLTFFSPSQADIQSAADLRVKPTHTPITLVSSIDGPELVNLQLQPTGCHHRSLQIGFNLLIQVERLILTLSCLQPLDPARQPSREDGMDSKSQSTAHHFHPHHSGLKHRWARARLPPAPPYRLPPPQPSTRLQPLDSGQLPLPTPMRLLEFLPNLLRIQARSAPEVSTGRLVVAHSHWAA